MDILSIFWTLCVVALFCCLISFSPKKMWLFWLALALPLERLPSFEFSGLSIRPSIIVALVVIFLSIGSLLALKSKIPKTGFALFLFLLAILPSLFFATNRSRAIEVFLFTLVCVLLAFSVMVLSREKDSLEWAKKGIIFAGTILAVFAIYQYIGDALGLPREMTGLKAMYSNLIMPFARVQSTFLEPLYFGAYLLLPIFILISRVLFGKITARLRVVHILCLALMVTALFLTLSRGSIIAFLAVLAIAILYGIRKKIVSSFVTFAVCLLLISAPALLLIKPDISSSFYLSHLTNFVSGSSVNERTNWRGQAFELFKQNSIFGVGLGNFGPAILGYPKEAPEGGWPIVNNLYLEILAETGIVGFSGFLLLFGYLLLSGIKILSKQLFATDFSFAAGTVFALAAILIQYLSFSTIYIFHFWFLIGLVLTFAEKYQLFSVPFPSKIKQESLIVQA